MTNDKHWNPPFAGNIYLQMGNHANTTLII